jgi:hypothetical protein
MFAYDTHPLRIGKGRRLDVINYSSRYLVSLVRDLLLGGYRDIDDLLLKIRYSDRPVHTMGRSESFFMEVALLGAPVKDYNRERLEIYVSKRLKDADPFAISGGLAHELAHERTGIFNDRYERRVDKETLRRGYGSQLLAMKRLMLKLNSEYEFLGYTPEEIEEILN